MQGCGEGKARREDDYGPRRTVSHIAGGGPRDTEFRKVDGIIEVSAQPGSDWAWRA